MTTTVQVIPAGHKVRVTKLLKSTTSASARTEEETLEPGSPARTFYVHSSMDLLVTEDVGQAQVPVVDGMSFEDDLLALEGEHEPGSIEELDAMISAYELRLGALRERTGEFTEDTDASGSDFES